MRLGAVLVVIAFGLLGTAVPHPAAASAAVGPRLPAQVLDLSGWKLTLPTGASGRAAEVRQPQLRSYSDEHFRLTARGDGVVFRAEVGGATTPHSRVPRSELREMRGGREASWSSTRGRHTMTLRAAVTAVPPRRPHVVAAQIHDGDDDVLQLRLEGTELSVQWDDGAHRDVLEPHYALGTPFDVTVVVADGRVQVAYDGRWHTSIPAAGDGWYFKAGSYVQSTQGRGEAGEVVVYSLRVVHSEQ